MWNGKINLVKDKLSIYNRARFKGYKDDVKNTYQRLEAIKEVLATINIDKKDEMHLNKHAMHLIRLLIMGTEILKGKGVNTYKKKDKDFLLKIRNGDYVTEKNGHKDYSLVFEIVDVYEKNFKYAAENTSLPDQPDCDAIDALVEAINLSV